MIQARFTRVLVASALMLTGFCGVANAQDTVLSDKILPPETFLRMSIPNVERLKDGFSSSSTGELWADPAFDDFKAELKSAFGSELDEGLANFQATLGLSAEEVISIPSGEATFAICSAGNSVGAVLFLNYGEHESQVEELMAKAVKALSNVDELSQADTEHDGTEITLFKVTSDVAKRTPLAKEFGWFRKDNTLVAANSKAVLELILNNWDGSSEKTLQSNKVYSYIMERCGSLPEKDLVTMYFDPIGLFTKLVQTGSLGEAGLGAGMAMGFLPTLGLNQLKAIGSVGQMDVDGFEGVSRSFVYAEQPPQGIMRMFLLDTVDPNPPSWVKEGASIYLSMNWKAGEAYDAVETLFDSFQGAGALASHVESLATQGPEVHIKSDIIDQLQGSLQMVQAPKGDADTGGSDNILFAVGVRDSAKMEALLTKLTSQPGFPGDSREFKGATLYEIDPGNGQKVSFTVANNMLMVGIGGTLLEQALRNDDDVRPLGETDEYRKISEHFRSGALAVTYTNPAAQYKSLYDLLKSGNAADNFPGMDELFSRIDFTRLPPFEVIEKYLAPAGGSWVGDENGVLMETFSLKPTR